MYGLKGKSQRQNCMGNEVTMSIMNEFYAPNCQNLYLEMNEVVGNICDGKAYVSISKQNDTLN